MDINHWPNNFINEWISPFWQIIALWFLVLAVMRMGKFGIALKNFNTLFHEIGHALMSLLFSGQVHKIELHNNAGGVAVTSNKSWISQFMVSIAGYPAGAAAGWAMFTQLPKLNSEYQVYVLLGIFSISLVLWVRNKYGMVWMIANCLWLGAVIYWQLYTAFSIYLFVVASCVMIESVWSVLLLVYISAEDPASAGDAQNLRELTFLPAIIWALVLTALTLFLFNLTLSGVIGWHIPLP